MFSIKLFLTLPVSVSQIFLTLWLIFYSSKSLLDLWIFLNSNWFLSHLTTLSQFFWAQRNISLSEPFLGSMSEYKYSVDFFLRRRFECNLTNVYLLPFHIVNLINNDLTQLIKNATLLFIFLSVLLIKISECRQVSFCIIRRKFN